MSFFSSAIQRLSYARDVVMFGHYHATTTTTKRTAPAHTTSSEDGAQTDRERKALVATPRQQRRNFEITQWMINLHLTRVARFSFQAKAKVKGNEERVREFNKSLELYISDRSSRKNFDQRQRYGLQEWMYLVEGLRTTDGDVFPMFVSDRSVQVFEGDRIDHKSAKNRPDTTGMNVTRGIRTDARTGRRIAYAVNKRAGKSLEFVRWVPEGIMTQLGYFIRHDQERGVSPLVTMINRAQDLYEGFDAMLIKTKMHAMFGIAFEDSDLSADDEMDTKDSTTGEAATADSETSDLDFELKAGLRVKTDGKVKTIESTSPHSSYIDWSFMMVMVAILALDIPMTFFDSRKSSYNARLMDVQRYEDATDKKRLPWREWLREWTDWQVETGLAFGEIRPGDFGLTADDIKYEWISAPRFIVDPVKDIDAFIKSMAAGVGSPQRFCKERSMDAYDIAEENADIQQLWRDLGIVFGVGSPGQEMINNEDDDKASDNDGDDDDE